MAESQLVSGLVEKRAELAGEVEHYQQELQRLAAELGHLDATIATWRRLNTASTAASISGKERCDSMRNGSDVATARNFFAVLVVAL